MASDRKRKRISNAEDEPEQPPAKAQIVEGEAGKPQPSTTDGSRRQKKSERKKKRDVQAKNNAKQKPQPVPSVAQDDLANGLDYVPIAKFKQPRKNKGRSPRSIRKEAREKKRASEMQNEEKEPQAGAQDVEAQEAGADARFICFVGNLPFSVTTEQIAAHFSKLQPKSIRLNTDKKTGKCKGFAFLEFDKYDKMKTCLKLYHHSIFNPEANEESGETLEQGHDSKPRGRKINVELTAGGGGNKSAGRNDKIKAKNKKLNDQRARVYEKRKNEKAEKSKGQMAKKGRPVSSPNGGEQGLATGNRGDIHPSRLSRVTG